MARFPFLPLYIDALFLDAGHLSDAEFGRYMRVLCYLWLAPQQRFPNDDAWLARKFRQDENWVKTELRPLLSEFCQSDGNWIKQKRLSQEFKRAERVRQSQSDRAKRRWGKENVISRGNADSAMPAPAYASTTTVTKEESTTCLTGASSENLSERILSTSPTVAREKTARDRVGNGENFFTHIPDWVPSEPWRAYGEMRKQAHFPLTPTARKLVIDKLDELRGAGEDPRAVLENATVMGWRLPVSTKLNGINGHGQQGAVSEQTLAIVRELAAKKD